MSVSKKQITGVRSISEATAVFSDAFQFPGMSINPDAPKTIERDRMEMAARPGMVRKLLPIRQDRSGVYCGGCYLFDTWENARDFANWVENEFVMDGKLFLDRPEFLEPTSQLWRIVAAEDFASVESQQKVMRFQRWHLLESIDPVKLREEWWPALREAAIDDGLTSAWLLVGTDEYHPQLGIVLAADGDPEEVTQSGGEGDSLHYLESWESPGERMAKALSGTKVFDRTSWIYMVWHPIAEGATFPTTAQWPVSPPLPGLL